MPSASDPSYCPYDVSDSASEFGLISDTVASRFGAMHVLRRPARTGDEATLMLHGVGATWTTWTPLLRAAGGLPGRDVVLVDLPGFGASENRLGHLASLDVAATLGEVITTLGYRRARLVGHSMGGLLALDMVARPQQLDVSSLHLAAGSGFAIIAAVNQPLRSFLTAPLPSSLFWGQYVVGRSRLGRSAVVALQRRNLLAPLLWALIAHPRRFPPRALAALVAEMAPASFRQAAANIAGYDAPARWAGIEVPVYAAFGARDRFVSGSDRRRLAEVRPQAFATVVADAAHFLHIERPHAVLEALDLP